MPEGLTLHTVAPNHDGTRVVCVWESKSLDDVRDFVETTAGAITTNEYFEVNEQKATGLPTGATAGATR